MARWTRKDNARQSSTQSTAGSNTSVIVYSNTLRPRWRQVLSTIQWLVFDQWFLFALGLLILISSHFQVPAVHQGQKETVITYLFVSIIFFITGCTLPSKILLDNYTRCKIHLFVQIQSFLMTSAVVYGVVSLCAMNTNFMDPGLLIGLIFMVSIVGSLFFSILSTIDTNVFQCRRYTLYFHAKPRMGIANYDCTQGCVPTTISSNVVMTKQANGNQALTVVQSTMGNFLGPFLTPILVELYVSSGAWYTRVIPKSGSFSELYRRVFEQLGLSVFLPLVCVSAHCRS